MKPVFPLLEEQQIEYLIYYPELFSAEDRRRVEKVLMLQGDLVGEGNTPSAFQIYTAYAPKNFTESPYASSINLEIITSASYQEPLQIVGNGIFVETTPIRKKREVIHMADLRNINSELSLLLQTQDGKKIWEGTLYPNPESDRIKIRAEAGPASARILIRSLSGLG